MSEIAEIDQTEFDNVPASVPLTSHDAAAVEPLVDAVEVTEVEPQYEEPIVETVDITEPLVDAVSAVESAVEAVVEPVVKAVSNASHAVIDAVSTHGTAIEHMHSIDSQEAQNARLLAADEAEDRQDEVEEINTELAAAAAAERKKRQQEALLAAIQQALAGTSGQSMEMFGLGGDEYDDYEDEEPEQEAPADTSMWAWLKSNVLPAAPISSYFTSRSLKRYGYLYSMKAGRYAWNIGTAGLLILLPYIIAHANELAFCDQFRETNRLQDLLNDAHSKGYEGHHSAPLGVAGQPQQQAHVASKAPPGYVPPPVSVAAIPQQ